MSEVLWFKKVTKAILIYVNDVLITVEPITAIKKITHVKCFCTDCFLPILSTKCETTVNDSVRCKGQIQFTKYSTCTVINSRGNYIVIFS